MEASHVDHAGGKGMGTKVADKFAVPMCADHHRLVHSIGWRSFEKAHDLDAVKAAAAYWWAWPGRKDWEFNNG